MTLSKPIKEGLFVYFDDLKIGMFDYQRFLSIMNTKSLKNTDASKQDNWLWQEEIIRKM